MGETRSLGEIGRVFLKLGTLGFGGPLAHVALMDHELVQRRGWIDRATFMQLYATTQLIPGPNSTELALHLGHRERGFAGLMVAGFAFIAPAFLASCLLAYTYQKWGDWPLASDILFCLRPIIFALVSVALFTFARQMPSRLRLIIGMVSALILQRLGLNEILCLALVASAFAFWNKPHSALPGIAGVLPFSLPVLTSPNLPTIFGLFFKIGAVLYGSGYSLLLYLREDFVVQRHWLSEVQLIDAITAGQITPGPLFSTATFIGYLLQGPYGAVAATVGIFLPAFIMIAGGSWLLPRWQAVSWSRSFLEGVNAGALGLMVLTLLSLGKVSLSSAPQVFLALGSTVVLTRTRCDPSYLIIFGIVLGIGRWLAS